MPSTSMSLEILDGVLGRRREETSDGDGNGLNTSDIGTAFGLSIDPAAGWGPASPTVAT